jgi:spermidine synthase
MAASCKGFDPNNFGRKFDAILADIDHSPNLMLRPENAAFYEVAGLAKLVRHLNPGGVFSLWSNDPPDRRFVRRLSEVFSEARAEEVTFTHPLQEREIRQTVYVARTQLISHSNPGTPKR